MLPARAAVGLFPRRVSNYIYNLKCGLRIECSLGRRGCFMIYRDVEFTVTAVAPGVWKWQFLIGDRLVSGKTEARLYLLAVRRVQMRIDRELKKAEGE